MAGKILVWACTSGAETKAKLSLQELDQVLTTHVAMRHVSYSLDCWFSFLFLCVLMINQLF